jgi:hypothetical protein
MKGAQREEEGPGLLETPAFFYPTTGESGRKEAHDARQDEYCPGSRVTVFLLQRTGLAIQRIITEQEIRSMKRRLTLLTLTTLAVVALIGVVSTAPSPALAGGTTQIAGVGFFDDTGECVDPEGESANFALIMTGDLEGCLYTFVETAESSPSGTYRETGTELFVASDSVGADTFATTYRFEAKYEDVTDPATEIFGRCQHPIVEGSGTGIYEGVSGQLFFKDDVEAGDFPYRGHLRY